MNVIEPKLKDKVEKSFVECENMNKISVFGGTGFIGGTFSRMYKENVTLIPRDSKNFHTNEVLYFISTTTNQNVFKDVHVDIDTNLKLFVDFLSNCKNRDVTINFISSGFVYGNDIIDAKETDCCNPTGFYSITKRCAEQLLISFCETFKIKYRIFRIGNVYGLDKTISPGKNVLAYMVRLLKEDKQIKLYDGGNFLKDYMFVEDICKSIKLIIDSGNINEVYNISSGESLSFRKIIENAKSIVNSSSEIIDVLIPPDQEFIQVKNMTLNNDKLKSLGFSCNTNFNDGLQILCDMI
jgi:nucleoside-diphosphate-sugar epimerase